MAKMIKVTGSFVAACGRITEANIPRAARLRRPLRRLGRARCCNRYRQLRVIRTKYLSLAPGKSSKQLLGAGEKQAFDVGVRPARAQRRGSARALPLERRKGELKTLPKRGPFGLALNHSVVGDSPALSDFGKLIADDTEKWGKVIKFSSAKLD